MSQSRKAMRRQLLARRRQLDKLCQQRAAQAVAQQVTRSAWFARARQIGVYLADRGELNPRPIIEAAWRCNKRVYLPVLMAMGGNRLRFVRYRPETRLGRNRFGIWEPCGSNAKAIDPLRLDLVLTPLVGFDAAGHRLGMGGGFYDRSFAFLNQRCCWRKPRLLGLAYAWQQLEQIPAEPWDVALDAVVTDLYWQRFHDVRSA